MQCDEPADRGEPGRGEQGHGPHLPQVDTDNMSTLSSLFFNWIDKLKVALAEYLLFQHERTQDPLGRVRWHRPLQLSCHDPSLDVPNGSHMWQHLHNEGMRRRQYALIVANYNLQPSERDPTACMALVELLKEAGEKKFQTEILLPVTGETSRASSQAALTEWSM